MIFHVLFISKYIMSHAGTPAPATLPIVYAGPRAETYAEKETTMQIKNKRRAAIPTASAKYPPCPRRRQGYPESVVKAPRQARRPASPPSAEVSKAGFHIEGCFLLTAATATPAAENPLHPDIREASAAARTGAQPQGCLRGAITKHQKIK